MFFCTSLRHEFLSNVEGSSRQAMSFFDDAQAEACVAASSASPADPTGTMRLAPAEMYGESALDVGEMWMEGLVRVVKGCHG